MKLNSISIPFHAQLGGNLPICYREVVTLARSVKILFIIFRFHMCFLVLLLFVLHSLMIMLVRRITLHILFKSIFICYFILTFLSHQILVVLTLLLVMILALIIIWIWIFDHCDWIYLINRFLLTLHKLCVSSQSLSRPIFIKGTSIRRRRFIVKFGIVNLHLIKLSECLEMILLIVPIRSLLTPFLSLTVLIIFNVHWIRIQC